MEITMKIAWIRRLLCLCFFLVSVSCLGADLPSRKPLPLSNPLQDKNFYLLSLLDRTPAVKAFREGKAPFIVVSGGYVHPPQTPYSEAIEMKKALLSEFGVPENAILADPHARVTLTNMRNTARLIYRYGIPFDRKALVVSDPSHISAVEGFKFNKDSLGYMPYRSGARLSPFALEFTPQIESLNTDGSDLLDP
jgi:uncharacterized SAM-binding protein YcdF (DUF218 family)